LLALWLSAWIFSAGFPPGFTGLPLAALVLTSINWLLRPLLMLVALPLNVVTQGLFVLVINAWMVMLADLLVKGWTVPGFWAALATGTLVLILNIPARRMSKWTQII
jgi:putative membrane protein